MFLLLMVVILKRYLLIFGLIVFWCRIMLLVFLFLRIWILFCRIEIKKKFIKIYKIYLKFILLFIFFEFWMNENIFNIISLCLKLIYIC